MAVNVKVAGAWKNALPRVKVSSVWKDVVQKYVKVGGVWKTLLAVWNGNLNNMVYDGITYNHGINGAQGLYLRRNGDSLYVISNDNNTVTQFTLNTKNSISSVTATGKKFIEPDVSNGRAVAFSPDGLTMIFMGTGSLVTRQVSTPFDVSTVVVSAGDPTFNPTLENQSLVLSKDGLKMYIFHQDGGNSFRGEVRGYTLSTPFDVSTATLQSSFVPNLGTFSSNKAGFINPDQDKMYLVDRPNEQFKQYTLTTPGDVSTASDDNVTYNYSADPVGNFLRFFMDTAGNRLIALESSILYQYTIN